MRNNELCKINATHSILFSSLPFSAVQLSAYYLYLYLSNVHRNPHNIISITMEETEKMDEMDGSKQTDGQDEESEGSEEIITEPLATTRSRRSNAGNRMGKLIQEEEDEFYKGVYGGFHEEEDDGDFDDESDVDDEEVEDDYDVDSDFSIDETDEIAPEHQIVEDEPRKKTGVYKDPKPRVQASNACPSSSTPVQPRPKPSSLATPQSPNKHRPTRSFRDSTRKKTAETIKNIEAGSRRKKKIRNMEAPKKLTQEEMLEEAKITEEENIKSLEIYQRLESEKLKKIKLTKKSLPVPYITYYSSVFTQPGTKEKYSRNLCTYVGCEPPAKTRKLPVYKENRLNKI